jgi:transcription elongation factor Elf1
MGKTLDDLFGDPKMAQEMILALQDTAAKAVGQEIENHRKLWIQKSPDDQNIALAQATAWATRHAGHRSNCPACGSPSLIRGTGRGVVSTEIDEDGDIIQRQTMLPSSFECIACGLKIAGLSKLSACGLGDTFTVTTTSSAAEFFSLHTDEELEEARRLAEPEFEEDSNE